MSPLHLLSTTLLLLISTHIDVSFSHPPAPPLKPSHSAVKSATNGRIFDISHRYTPHMPAFASPDGVGQFLWLPKSMKNGSIANNSEMTHVDAPGHVFDGYFDDGFDVNALDLGVLILTGDGEVGGRESEKHSFPHR